MTACMKCGVTLDGVLANELAASAHQLNRAAANVAFAGDGAGVRVKDPTYLVALLRRAAIATDSARKPRREMVLADIYIGSPHRFPDDMWGGAGRTDCKVCGVYHNSVYDDETGCRGPWWMRCIR